MEENKRKKKSKKNKCLKNKNVEEDDELPDLIPRHDDSSVSDDEQGYVYKHTGFNTDNCPLESWADEMIEWCEEEIRNEKLEAKKKRRTKKNKKPKTKTVNKEVESNITLKKESILPPLLFCKCWFGDSCYFDDEMADWI